MASAFLIFLVCFSLFALTVGLVVYFITHGGGHRVNFQIRTVRIPDNTTLNSIDDVKAYCTDGFHLGTVQNFQNIPPGVGYSYCTRGYVEDATIIPISPQAIPANCTADPGLNQEAATFPCRQQRQQTQLPACAEVAFCVKGSIL